jgi:hypothetical protein
MVRDDVPPPRTFHLDLTASEMRITEAALRSFLGDFGHDERDVQERIRAVLRKLPQHAPPDEAERLKGA